MKNIEETKTTINKTLFQTKKLAVQYLRELEDDNEEMYAYQKLSDLIHEFVQQEEICGGADAYHNFAVELAREKQEHLACMVIMRGLKQFPANVDLLADYLQYGALCGKEKECQEIYKKLLKIPHEKWTWRAFSFSINYLQHIIDDLSSDTKKMDAARQTIEKLCEEYVKYMPDNEEGYRMKARVFSSIKSDYDAELRILEEGLSKVKVCPKSSIRCADIYFERGEYEKALQCVERAIKDANQKHGTMNEGYVYYLSGLCKISLLWEKDRKAVKGEDVTEIYEDFNGALIEFGYDIDVTYRNVMTKKARMLKSRYGVEVPYSCEKLLENIDE